MKTDKEKVEVMNHFIAGGKVEYRSRGSNYRGPASTPVWNWGCVDFRIAEEADPYAELKAAAADPTKQTRLSGEDWRDAGHVWSWCFQPEDYEIRDKPKPLRKVKLLAWLVMGQLLLIEEGRTCIGKRVPGKDTEIEVQDD